jgi:hypothetical protein
MGPATDKFTGSDEMTISDGAGETFTLEIRKSRIDMVAAVTHHIECQNAGTVGQGRVDPTDTAFTHSLNHASVEGVLSEEGLKQLRRAANMTWHRFGAAETQTTVSWWQTPILHTASFSFVFIFFVHSLQESGIGAGVPTRFDQGQPIVAQYLQLGVNMEQAMSVQTRSNYFRETFHYSDYGIADPRFDELLNSPKLAAAAKTIFEGRQIIEPYIVYVSRLPRLEQQPQNIALDFEHLICAILSNYPPLSIRSSSGEHEPTRHVHQHALRLPRFQRHVPRHRASVASECDAPVWSLRPVSLARRECHYVLARPGQRWVRVLPLRQGRPAGEAPHPLQQRGDGGR